MESGRGIGLARTWPAHQPSSSSSGGSGGAGESNGSLELLATPKTSDDSYEPRARAVLGAGQPRPAADATDLDGVGAGA